MYTHMKFDKLLIALEDAYKKDDKNMWNIPYPDASDLIFLIKCLLENNYFEN